MTRFLLIACAWLVWAPAALAQISDVAASASDGAASPFAFLVPVMVPVIGALSSGAAEYLTAHPGWLAGIVVALVGGIIDGLKTKFVLPIPFATEALKLLVPPLGRWVERTVTAWLDGQGRAKGGGK